MSLEVSRVGVVQAGEAAESEAALAFDLLHLEPCFLDDPFPTYRRLRRHDPVHRCPDGSYFLTRYDDVAEVYRDHHRLSSDKKVEFEPKFGDGPLYEHHTTSLVFRDPPDHTRIRRLFAAAFTPRALAALEPRVVRLVDGLLDRAEARRGMDLIADYAFALPVELIADRRRHPTGDDAEVLTALLAAEDAGDKLTEIELLHQCIFLLNAGHETTTNLIGNGVAALLDNPAELGRLRGEPALIETAVEEFLRYESSNQLGNRRPIADVVIGGVPMPAGTLVTLCIGAANRDPAQFPDPDRLDITRAPNRHLAFATGIHACAGMWLARMEGRVAIGRLVTRFPRLERAGPFVRGGRARFRGFASYPVACG